VNYLELKGHKGAVLDLHWSRDSQTIFSASADKDARLASWDIESKTRIRKYVGHEDIVTSLDVSRRAAELVISGSDDGTIGVRYPFVLWPCFIHTAILNIHRCGTRDKSMTSVTLQPICPLLQ
jgi:WD40 repeat protein